MHLRRDACYSGTPGSKTHQKISEVTSTSLVFCGCFFNSCRGDIVAWNIWEASKHHQTISNIQCRPSNKTTRYNRCMSASITNNSHQHPKLEYQIFLTIMPRRSSWCTATRRLVILFKHILNADGCGDPQHSQALSCWLCKRLATLTGINCAQWAIWDGCCTNAVTLYSSIFYT